MNIEEFVAYCHAKKGVEESFPFGGDTLVYKVLGKMFALTALESTPCKVNLKCDPERSILLREEHEEDIIPGYHMNKTHWNTVNIEGSLDESLIKELIDHSYDLIVQSLPRKVKAQLDE